MNKIWIALCVLLIFTLNVFSQVQIVPLDQPPQGADAARWAEINAKISELSSKVDGLLTKSDADSSFSQLDKQVGSAANVNALSSGGLILIIVLVNDVLLAALYLIFKPKGLIP